MKKFLLVALVLVGLSVSWRSQPPAWDAVVPPAEAFYRASIIKSIQVGSITTNTGGGGSPLSGTATLTTAVSSTSTIIVPGGTTTAAPGNFSLGLAAFVLTNPTTVTMTCMDDAVSSPICAGTFTAIEFYPNVLSSTGVQRGVITMAAAQTSNTATITSVVTSKTMLVPCGFYTNGTVTSYRAMTKEVLTNATTVTASRNATDGATPVVACWQTAEFK